MDEPFEPTEADVKILQDTTPDFRVFNTTVSTFNDASTSYFHKSIGGYHGAKLKRYQELWENQLSKGNMGVINMLNTRYIIQQDKSGSGGPVALLNPLACGNAWFVPQIQWAENADAELKALTDFDPRKKAVVDSRFKDTPGLQAVSFDSTASIGLKSYRADKLVYTYHSNAAAPVVFSEIYYDKGWKATCNGKDLPLFRCNYVLRGAVLPAGNGEVVFEFRPEAYSRGEQLSLISSILLLLFFGFSLFVEFRKKSENPLQ